MRRCLTPLAAVVLALAALAVGSCGGQAGGSNGLTDGWTTPGAVHFFMPVAGHCYDNSDDGDQSMAVADFQDIPCDVQHDEEVVTAQMFTAGAASMAFSPRPGTDVYRMAWQQCVAAANTYLGGDWHDALAVPGLVVPNDGQWGAGDRNYVCDLTGRNTPHGSTMFRYYRNGLAGARPVGRACFTFEGTAMDKDGYFTALSTSAATTCDTAHDAEYVATLQADDTTTKPVAGSQANQADWLKCIDATAAFLSRSAADMARKTDIEPFWFWPTDQEWTIGDHSFACYVTVPSSRAVSRSLKGIGSSSPT